MKAQKIENPTTKKEQIKWTSSYNTHLTAIENSCTKRHIWLPLKTLVQRDGKTTIYIYREREREFIFVLN